MTEYKNIITEAVGTAPQKAEELFLDELSLRTSFDKKSKSLTVKFVISEASEDESFEIKFDKNTLIFSAHRLRGLIYAYSLFLRKCSFKKDRVLFDENICGEYSPDKKIRGHQIGYRDLNNTYDAWDEMQYRRYFLDLMMFGMNTYEGIPDVKEEQGVLMKYDAALMFKKTSEICMELDLDVSSWQPTRQNETDEEAIKKTEYFYKDAPKLNAIFIPGGDPGDMMPHELFKRCRLIKETAQKYHPDVKLWISAQAPHEYKSWGEKFIEEIKKEPEFIDGIIYGPNHAMSLAELRQKLPQKYSLRFYPDITHSVRCEYPVHYDRDDWHYAFASAFGRESIAPRPTEYIRLYSETESFFDGSVSYSDGIHDDINKVVFSALDFNKSTAVKDILKDYANAYIPFADKEKIADIIIMLEKNWLGAPDESPEASLCLDFLQSLAKKDKRLLSNFRFVMLLFRAECDCLVKSRFVFENELLKEAKRKITDGDIGAAEKILLTDFSPEYKKLRKGIDKNAKLLFELIGIQLDVKNYHGRSWERGCTLETIDKPITDRVFYLNKIKESKKEKNPLLYMQKICGRNKVKEREIYFSFALDGFSRTGRQKGEFYMDFQGDTPRNDGSLPMCMTKVYDHFNFGCSFGSLTGKNYKLRITYKKGNYDESTNDFCIIINDNLLYRGKPYGGKRDEKFEKIFLKEPFISVVYDIPNSFIENGFAKIKITEPTAGFMMSEFWITEE